MRSRIIVITGTLTMVLLSFVLLTSLSSAQSPAGWLTHTSDKCKMSFSYPSDWKITVETEDRFDKGQGGEVYVKSINSLPGFTIMTCKISNLSSSELESNLDTLYSVITSIEGTEIIEYTHLVPKVLSNSTIDAYVTTYKGKDVFGFEHYDLLHNGMEYSFLYSDLPSHFDSPESKDIRAKILQSINFIK